MDSLYELCRRIFMFLFWVSAKKDVIMTYFRTNLEGINQQVDQFILNIFLPTTLPETNSKSPENGWLEDEFPFGTRPIFRGKQLVSGRVPCDNGGASFGSPGI